MGHTYAGCYYKIPAACGEEIVRPLVLLKEAQAAQGSLRTICATVCVAKGIKKQRMNVLKFYATVTQFLLCIFK